MNHNLGAMRRSGASQSKWGSCDFCMNTSLALCVLGLLVLGLGMGVKVPILAVVGGAAGVSFGVTFALHVVFFFAREAAPEVIDNVPAVGPSPSNRGCGCSRR